MIVTYRNGDLFSAATSLAVICHNATRAEAVAAIVGAVDGVTLAEVDALLAAPAPPQVWRATLTAALQAETSALRGDVEALADSDVAARLSARIAVVTEIGESLRQEQQQANKLAAHANRIAQDRLAFERQRDAEAKEKAAERQRESAQAMRRAWRLYRFSDGSADLVDSETKRIIRRFKPGQEIDAEALAYEKV